MELDWEGLFKKYIWNDQSTPYLTAVQDLNQRQGKSEIFAYSLLLGVFFSVVALISLSGGPDERSLGVGFYSFSVVCAAVIFGIMKSYPAALYLSATPVVALAYLFIYGFSYERETIDTVIVTIILLALLRYSLRIVAVARAYPSFPYVGKMPPRKKTGGL